MLLTSSETLGITPNKSYLCSNNHFLSFSADRDGSISRAYFGDNYSKNGYNVSRPYGYGKIFPHNPFAGGSTEGFGYFLPVQDSIATGILLVNVKTGVVKLIDEETLIAQIDTKCDFSD